MQAGSAVDPLALTVESGRLLRGESSDLQLPTPDGAIYSDLAAVGGREWVAAASYLDGDGTQRLMLVTGGEGEEIATLRSPPRQNGRLRQDAVLFVDGGRLVGMAWLEGDEISALEVRAARWTGRRFRGVHRVAAAAAGSQLALTGAVLADGSWLLAWTAFDGQDDEVFWTQRIGSRWSDPARVSPDNAVPDITPALALCGTGAVIAWSRYDGNDYRLEVARFRHGSWEEVEAGTEAGSLYPAFVSGPEDPPRVIYRVASSGAWQAMDFDSDGRPSRQAKVTGAPRQRPVVATSEGRVEFRWSPSEGPPMSAVWQPILQDPAP